ERPTGERHEQRTGGERSDQHDTARPQREDERRADGRRVDAVGQGDARHEQRELADTGIRRRHQVPGGYAVGFNAANVSATFSTSTGTRYSSRSSAMWNASVRSVGTSRRSGYAYAARHDVPSSTTSPQSSARPITAASAGGMNVAARNVRRPR